MDFGMPTLIEYDSVVENAALCREPGLSFLELNMNLPHCQSFGGRDIERLGKIAEENGIYYTLHLDENADFCNFNPVIKEGWQRVLKETLSAARELGIPVINTHLSRGVWFTLPERKIFLYEKYRSHYIESIEELKDICAPFRGKIRVSVENTNGFMPFERAALERLITEPNIGLTWDIGHCEAAGNKDEDFMVKNLGKLYHMHVHDALAGKDHLTLGEGQINLDERLRAAEEAGCRCVVEVKTSEALRNSVLWLRENKGSMSNVGVANK